MNLSVGIVGLPNVGKSTLFNALLKKQQALSANYPFATIEPNVGIVAVPDERLQKLAEIVANEKSPSTSSGSQGFPPLRPATVEFYDIAGLVKGASEGAGLGNKFLSHIRETKVIAHVVRAFEDPDVIKEGAVDPKSDYEVINAELILADLATLENSKLKSQKSKPQFKNQNFLNELTEKLEKGIPVRDIKLADDEKDFIDPLFLLSAKPEIVVLNVSEDQYTPEGIKSIESKYKEILRLPSVAQDDNFVVISAKIESELASLSDEEQKEYLKDLGLESSGLERLIQKAYGTLGLISFLTAGEKEVRAWTIRRGFTALMASGEIHTDFMKKFIKAEVVSFDDFVTNNGPARNASTSSASVAGGWKGAREKGKARLEGKDYVMQDGDVVEFKIGT